MWFVVCGGTAQSVPGGHRKVAIKKVANTFKDLVDAKRILRELKLLRHLGGGTVRQCPAEVLITDEVGVATSVGALCADIVGQMRMLLGCEMLQRRRCTMWAPRMRNVWNEFTSHKTATFKTLYPGIMTFIPDPFGPSSPR